jgi:hypothetical protein
VQTAAPYRLVAHTTPAGVARQALTEGKYMANVKDRSFVKEPLSVLFTEAQHKAIAEAATEYGWPKANFARRAAVELLIHLGMYDPNKDPDNKERFNLLKDT